MLSKARREIAFWRDLLKRIAKDLEAGAKAADDPAHRAWLESRARRVRERLVRGMPDDWKEPDD